MYKDTNFYIHTYFFHKHFICWWLRAQRLNICWFFFLCLILTPTLLTGTIWNVISAWFFALCILVIMVVFICWWYLCNKLLGCYEVVIWEKEFWFKGFFYGLFFLFCWFKNKGFQFQWRKSCLLTELTATLIEKEKKRGKNISNRAA